MRKVARTNLVLFLIFVLLALASCSLTPSGSSNHDAGEVVLCDVNDDLIGWFVITQGQISFIDLTLPDGVYFELDDGACEIGVFVHNDLWLDFSDEQQAQMALDNDVEIQGIVTREDGQMIISVQDLVEQP